ncbi:hypothetical protein [Bradyrhizobium retamae]|uniref:Uncharacterized protein n=1 Tax=Bradyrhizobium retamae TaxID=1300035 RepID=A0A0R3NA44_9BRAD|nr:hypothetical protein [Bradyrhizobium retamae]KRR28922.1 hypothetical protein CQ13_18980 [Bradyrhizobium retamae]
MTFAEFIAACFWPLVALFGFLLTRTRDRILSRWFLTAALVAGFSYFGLWVLYPQSSIIAILNFYLLGGLFGLYAFGWGCNSLQFKKPIDVKNNLKGIGILLFGAVIVWFFMTTVYQDLFQERIVLEGRAQNPRNQARYRGLEHVVDIAGRTVKATTPVYERLRLLPYVRAEIGRGSNYIYKVEYRSN